MSVPCGEAVAGMAAYDVIAVRVYAKRFTGYRTGHRLTSPGLWSRVCHGTAPALGVSRPHPSYDPRPRDRGGVRAGVIPARYSMTYVKRYQRWFIVDHHSSVIGKPSCKSITP